MLTESWQEGHHLHALQITQVAMKELNCCWIIVFPPPPTELQLLCRARDGFCILEGRYSRKHLKTWVAVPQSAADFPWMPEVGVQTGSTAVFRHWRVSEECLSKGRLPKCSEQLRLKPDDVLPLWCLLRCQMLYMASFSFPFLVISSTCNLAEIWQFFHCLLVPTQPGVNII